MLSPPAVPVVFVPGATVKVLALGALTITTPEPPDPPPLYPPPPPPPEFAGELLPVPLDPAPPPPFPPPPAWPPLRHPPPPPPALVVEDPLILFAVPFPPFPQLFDPAA